MTRRKVNDNARLTRKIGLRVSDPFYKKMKGWMAQSNCRSVGELARAILYEEKINWYHTNAELESTSIELAGIKKELNAIGKNVNQITHYFNGTAIPNQKIFHALKVLDEYKKVSDKVDRLLTVTSQISKKWLQG